MAEQEKRKCFEKDYDFRKTLITEESFENMNYIEQEKPNYSSSRSTEQCAKPSAKFSHFGHFCSFWASYGVY